MVWVISGLIVPARKGGFMENTREIVVNLKFSSRKSVLFLALFFIAWHPGFLGSESLTLTTYYPAPYGGYVGLLTTGTGNINTILARNGGSVGIGTAGPGQKLDVNGSINTNANITATSKITAGGEITGMLTSGFGQFRAISGNYGAFIRNDGNDTYMPLITAAGDPTGVWNGLRPVRVNNASGDVWLANSQVQMRHSDGAVVLTGAGGIAFNGSGGITGLCRTVSYGVNWSNVCNANETPMAMNGDGGVRMCGMFQAGGALNVGTGWIRYCFGGDWGGNILCCRMK
jgi:hypothetical protein